MSLRVARARKVVGVDLSLADCTGAFERLGLPHAVQRGIDPGGADAVIVVTPPPARFDLEIEEDLIEEVVRLWGYDRLPVRAPRARALMREVPEARRTPAELRRAWAARDWQEVVNFSFVSGRVEALVGDGRAPVPLRNPIAETLDVMRTTLWGPLLGNLRHNVNRRAERARLFELGRVFLREPAQAPGALDVAGIVQPWRLAGVAWGPAAAEQWGLPTRPVDFHDVKGDLEATAARPLRFAADRHPALHPGRCARLLDGSGAPVGWLGELHPRLLGPLDLPAPPILFEVALDAMLDGRVPSFTDVSRFPPAVRDLAFVVPLDLAAGRIVAELDRLRAAEPALAALRDVRLFDEYRGKGLENKEKSLAFRFWMQDTQRTLADAEVDAAVRVIVAALQETLGARLRS